MAATQSLPVTEDTIDDRKVYVEKEQVKVIEITNNTGSAVDVGDFAMISGFFGIVLKDAANGEKTALQIDDEITVQADDLHASATFGTVGDSVYYNFNTALFDDLGQGVLVGKLLVAKDANGTIVFVRTGRHLDEDIVKLQYTIAADATGGLDVDFGYNFTVVDVRVNPSAAGDNGGVQVQDSSGNEISDMIPIDNADAIINLDYTISADGTGGLTQDFGYNFTVLEIEYNPSVASTNSTLLVSDGDSNAITDVMPIENIGPYHVLEYNIDSDHSAGVNVDFGFDFEIVDVLVHPDATSGGGTVQLADSSGNAITDAMTAAVVDTLARPATIDGTNGYHVIADGTIKFTTNGAADRATVYITVKPVAADPVIRAKSIDATHAVIPDGTLIFTTGNAADRGVVRIKAKKTLTDRLERARSIATANATVSDGTLKFVTEHSSDRAVVYIDAIPA